MNEMYTQGVIRLANSYLSISPGGAREVSVSTTYAQPRRLVGTRKELLGQERKAKSFGMNSRRLFG